MALIPVAVEGTDGQDGQDGADGAAATIAVGTVTTGAAGSSAAVTNAGTSNAAILNFTIPRGATGAPGGYTSGPGYGSTTDLAAYVNTTTNVIAVPLADANYTVTLSNATVGASETYFTLQMPTLTGSDKTTTHWVRITFTILDVRREVGWSYWRDNDSAALYGAIQQRGQVVEPGPEPGSVSTITYVWNPTVAAWVVDGWSGDVALRRYHNLGAGRRTSSDAVGIPAWASPESYTTGASELADCVTALQAVPSWLKGLLGRKGAWVDLGYQGLNETLTARASASGGTVGNGIRAVGTYDDQTGAIASRTKGDGWEAMLKGFVMLHELGHAVDYLYYPAANEMAFTDEQAPSPALSVAGWQAFLWNAPDLLVSNDPAVTALHDAAKATGNLTAYYYNTRSEWFAQALALAWSADVAGYSTSNWNNIAGVTMHGGTTSIYTDFVAFLESVYIR